MHANGALLERLFTALDRHDHPAMASCYHEEATFRDIAFDLRGRRQIHAMWDMICAGDIRATFDVLEADDRTGWVRLVDVYTFGATPGKPDTGRPVRNVIDSHFRFRDGLIVEHTDDCDPRQWAAMALGGATGFLAGHVAIVRRRTARKKLDEFVRTRSEYREQTSR
jgi:ketosteroid isomerase-like protein